MISVTFFSIPYLYIIIYTHGGLFFSLGSSKASFDRPIWLSPLYDFRLSFRFNFIQQFCGEFKGSLSSYTPGPLHPTCASLQHSEFANMLEFTNLSLYELLL